METGYFIKKNHKKHLPWKFLPLNKYSQHHEKAMTTSLMKIPSKIFFIHKFLNTASKTIFTNIIPNLKRKKSHSANMICLRPLANFPHVQIQTQQGNFEFTQNLPKFSKVDSQYIIQTLPKNIFF